MGKEKSDIVMLKKFACSLLLHDTFEVNSAMGANALMYCVLVNVCPHPLLYAISETVKGTCICEGMYGMSDQMKNYHRQNSIARRLPVLTYR